MKIVKLDKETFRQLLQKPFVQVFFIAAALNLFVDSFSRESFFKAVGSIFTQPLVFLYNMLIIAITLTPALFFARRYFAYLIISLLWVIVGITDFILLQFRTTPFTFVDITMIKSAINIWDHYLTAWQLAMIGVLLFLVAVLCIMLFRKMKKHAKMPFVKVATSFVILLASCIVATEGLVRFRVLAENFGNLADAYHSYGLPYCFVSSVLNTGIPKPKNYSDEYMQTLLTAIENGTLISSADPNGTLKPEIPEKEPTVTPEQSAPTPEPTPTEVPEAEKNPSEIPEKPNVIFLQLESFFDPTTILGSSFTKDPLPNFHRLMEEYTSGNLSVPSVGAGTANTEFEVITGMNLDFFGPGEYPYKTILKETTCESIAYVLKSMGYGTHAIHNNDGTFYERHLVFPNLGFDTFTSIEYMREIERTPLNWAKDFVLTEEIKKSLESTEEPDFIYAISVQGHGSYPSNEVLSNPVIDLELPENFSEETYYQLLYYINQIYEMDVFVGELVDYLKSTGEDTVLVMYGDHLPGMKFTQEQLSNGNLFQTPYVVWSSFDMEAEHKDFEAYQLYSYVLDRLDIHNGIINRFHQTQMESDIYEEDLKVLEYDMLYGNQNAYNGENPYPAVHMQMGIDKVTITAIRAFADSSAVIWEENTTEENIEDQEVLDSDATEYSEKTEEKDKSFWIFLGRKDKGEEVYTVFLTGSNFTPYSNVQVDGEKVSTMYISDTILSAIMPLPQEGSEITVVQQGSDEQELSSSEPFVITEKVLENIFPKDNPTLEGED